MSSDHVELRVPASGAYVSVLRTAAAGLAARLDFTIDDIEDLRIAVDEACAVLLPLADADARLTARFDLEPGSLQVAVSVPSTRRSHRAGTRSPGPCSPRSPATSRPVSTTAASP